MNCKPLQTAPGLIDAIMQAAGVQPGQRQKAIQGIEETKFVDGFVVDVQTRANGRRIVVGQPGSEFVTFDFPHNNQVFETELIRAQDHNRSLTAHFQIDKQNINTLLAIDVYAYPPLPTSSDVSRTEG